MNSCLYRCEVMHHRLFPTEHKFRYNIFMFYIDLDELEMLGKTLLFFSNEHFNWFNFRKEDHLQFPLGRGHNDKTVKQNVQEYLLSQGRRRPIARRTDRRDFKGLPCPRSSRLRG